MKRLLLLLAAALMVIFMAACAGGGTSGGEDAGEDNDADAGSDSEETDSGESEDGEITLRMSWWGSQGRHDMTNEIIELYEEQNPNVSIEPDFTGFDGYFEKLSTQAAGGNMPDIIQQNHGEFVNQYAGQGQLADLTEFVDDGTIELEGVSDTIMESGEVEGTLVGIPTGVNALAGLYDPEMIDEAGAEQPTADWTWEEFSETAQTITDETGNYGVRLMEPGNMFEYYLREKGQRLFNDDGSGLGYDDDQLLTDYFTMNKDFVDAGVSPGYDTIGEIQGLEDELLARGEAAFDFRWTNQLGTMVDSAGRNIEMTPLPGENNTDGMYLKPAMLWSIGENSEHKEEAAKFINFYTNEVEVYQIQGADRGVPISPEVQEAMEPELSETDQQVYEYIDELTDNSSPIDNNFPPEAAEVLNSLADTDELVIYGELSPEEGAEQFRMEAESILGQ
ncbi:ABC transporter substrate-binding protein [Alteribacillus sp. HJP-4]|uniref:ABC transporter substrate-binding protein n=1 Tax=Alteribacillus sp. HJP-4 TaxID=2775394 RepID=UPI0035CD321E